MRLTSTVLIVALVSGGFAMLVPAVGALDVGCTRADASGVAQVTTLPAGTSTLVTPPGADVLGWTPECVIIPNGGSVIFTQRDAIDHGVVNDDCGIMLGRMSVSPTDAKPDTTSLKLDIDLDGLALLTLNGADTSECTLVGDDQIEIAYYCEVHGPAMPGKIIVEL